LTYIGCQPEKEKTKTKTKRKVLTRDFKTFTLVAKIVLQLIFFMANGFNFSIFNA